MVMEQAGTLEEIRVLLSDLVNKPSPQAPGFMSFEEAEQYSSLSVKTLRRLAAAGKLVAYRPVRGRCLLDRAELSAFIRSTANARPRRRPVPGTN